ncbi:histidine kinase dimerization/phosphoacceptor domain -containing protein [Methylobacterium nigriterrae]|uniref:histidine kinase dimerization/phosphoacceptor domain -containing protein n=1 Tax=Methylobacterium nigriterrae TaxID=3127512 RepID=UPI0030139844
MPDHEQMMRRQQVLANFGEFALCSEDLDEVLTEACRLVGEALGTHRAKVLEIQEHGQCLFVRAGVGWDTDVVGHVRLPMKEHSSETFAIKEGKPVITQDIHTEERFEVPEFMKKAGVVALVNVPIFLLGRKAFGLLQVDASEPRDFAQEDIEFLRTYATILGPVIDRLFKVHDLQVALDANKHLLQELQHRIKNHIGIITSLVRMRVKEVGSDEARQELAAVGERVEALRLVHELLYAANSAERLRLRPYVMRLIENLCHMHQGQSGKVRLEIEVEEVDLGPDTVVPLGLILNEFVTNSLKYAFDGQGGVIAISVEALEQGAFRVRIRDNGKGLPSEPQAATPGSGTGMRLIEALARQIGARPHWSSVGGTALCLEFTPR